MADQGWIKLHRALLEKPIWECSTTDQKVILITLLMMANHDQKEWIWQGEKYKCEPGQFITSLDKIAKRSGTSIQSVRTALKNFEKTFDFLTSKSTNKNRLVTITNWEVYQSSDAKPNKQTNRRLTSNQQAANKQLTTNKNDKELKNDKEDISSNLKNKFPDDAISMILANELYNLILVNNPDSKKPNLQKWAKTFDLMLRLDKGRTEQSIRSVMRWSQQDSFWLKNILSPDTLRKKFDQLTLGMKSPQGKTNGPAANLPKTPKGKYDGFYL